MDRMLPVAEKVLDYWCTVEFLAQDKFYTQSSLDRKDIRNAKKGKSKRKNIKNFMLFNEDEIDTLYESIISEVSSCRMKCWGNLTFYVGKLKREICVRSIAKFMKYNENWPEKNYDEIAWASFQLSYNGQFIKDSLALSSILWTINRLYNYDSNISNIISIEDYYKDINKLEKEIFIDKNVFDEAAYDDAQSEILTLSPDRVPISDIKKLSNKILDLYIKDSICDANDEQAYEVVYGVCFDMYVDETEKNNAGDDNYLSINNNFFLDDLEYYYGLVRDENISSIGMDKSLLEYVTGLYFSSCDDRKRINMIEPPDIGKYKCQVYDIINLKNAPLGKWPSKYNPAFMQQIAINLQIGRCKKEYDINGMIFSVNGPPGTGKTTLLKEIIVNNIVERAKLLAQYDNPDDAFVRRNFMYGDNTDNAYSKYIRGWYELSNDEINNYSVLVTSCNNTAVENVSKELPRGKDLFEGLEPSEKDPDEYKKTLNELADLFRVEKTGLNEEGKNGELFKDIYFTKHSRELLEDENSWGLIAAALGKKSNIYSFYNKVLAPIIFNDFYWNKNNAKNRHNRYLETKKLFLQQLKRVQNIQRELAEISECAKYCCEFNHYYKELCKWIKNKKENIENEIGCLEKKIITTKEKYNRIEAEKNEIYQRFINERERYTELQNLYNDRQAYIQRCEVEMFGYSKHTGLFIKLFNRKKYQLALDNIRSLEEKCKVFSDELKGLEFEKKIIGDNCEKFEINYNLVKKHQDEIRLEKCSLEDRKKVLTNEINNLLSEIQENKEKCDCNKNRLKHLIQKSMEKGFMDVSNIIDDQYIERLLSTDIKESTDAHVYNPWTSKRYDCERIKLFNYAMRLNKEFVLSTNMCRDNFKILSQYWGFMMGDDKKRIKFHPKDKEEFVGALYQTLFLLTPVISSTFASIGRIFKDVKKKGVIGTLIVDEAGQAQPQMAIGALFRSRKAMIVGDPKQVEPVVTEDLDLLKKLFNNQIIIPYSRDKTLSVQGFADEINPFGTYLPNLGCDDVWVGCPLVVHRRCISPMYDISNEISYNGIMKQQTLEPKKEIIDTFLHDTSCWIDVVGKEEGEKRHFVPEQGKVVCNMIEKAFEKAASPDLYIISPFKTVVSGVKNAIEEYFRNKGSVPKELDKWLEKNIGTVHKFQGKDAQEVIFLLGCDKSEQSSGAITWVNANIVNVAVTRAKSRLYIIGDSEAWKKSACVSKAKEIIELSYMK